MLAGVGGFPLERASSSIAHFRAIPPSFLSLFSVCLLSIQEARAWIHASLRVVGLFVRLVCRRDRNSGKRRKAVRDGLK